MTCPACGLENQQSARECDCGFEFALEGELRASVLRRRRFRRRSKVLCATLLAMLISAVLFSPNLIWKKIASGERYYPDRVTTSFGYVIEKPWSWRDAFRIRFYGDSFSIQLEARDRQLQSIVEQRWLCNDRVIYLHIHGRDPNNSLSGGFPVKVLYDFERGELYAFCPGCRWPVLSPKPLPDRSAKEAEIDAILTRIERECQAR